MELSVTKMRNAYVESARRAAMLACALALASSSAGFAQGGRGQAPPRDPAARTAPPAGTASIAGRVLAADTGRPMKRARVQAQSPQSGGRTAITDADGRFEIAALPAGKYTVTATKTGFVSVSYGQRRPLQASTPIDVADNQQIKNVELRLPRGSVITGHVFDEDGQPIAQVAVRVMRWAFQQGERRLQPVGNDQTDDRGEYRVFGLPPGEYVVSAVSRNADMIASLRSAVTSAIAAAAQGRGGRGAGAAARFADPLVATDDDENLTFAPTYYPGVITIAEAAKVPVTLAQEATGIDFSLQLVRTARVAGVVTSPSGPIAGGSVSLMPELAGAGAAINLSSRVENDGSFQIANVPPGRYTLVARTMPAGRGRGGNAGGPQQFAVMPVTISGQDVTGVGLILGTGATIAGTITFENGQSAQSANATQIRVSAPMVGGVQIPVRNGMARVEQDGTFVLDGVPAGLHLIRANAPGGWWLKSVQVSGRDAIDAPFEVKDGQQVRGVTLVFSNLVTQLAGTVTDDRNQPVSGVNVIAFSTQSVQWIPQTRTIQAVRPDQNGRFQMRGLPPGEYFVAAVDGAEQGEWFDPAFLNEIRTHATRVLLSDGENRSQDLKAFTVGQ